MSLHRISPYEYNVPSVGTGSVQSKSVTRNLSIDKPSSVKPMARATVSYGVTAKRAGLEKDKAEIATSMGLESAIEPGHGEHEKEDELCPSSPLFSTQ